MSYQWGPTGPAFEIRDLFRDENRWLVVRGALAAGLALLLLVLTQADLGTGWATTARRLLRNGSAPHMGLAALLLLLAAIDLWRAWRQRVLRMLPGEPAPLVPPLVRQSSGGSPEAEQLAALIGGAPAPVRELTGPYRAVLKRLAPGLAGAPASLQDWLERRLAHLLLLVVLLFLLPPVAWLVPPGGAIAVALPAALLILAVFLPEAFGRASPPRPLALVVAALLVAAVGGGAGMLLGPRLSPALAQAGWTAGLLAGLLALIVIEALALIAGRAGIDPAMAGGSAQPVVRVEMGAAPERVLQEVERELHRYWVEGVPNRRYAWTSNLAEHKAGGARFVFSALEESQPVPMPVPDAPERPGGARRGRLLALLWLAPLLTVAGGALWALVMTRLASLAPMPWTAAASALALLLAAGHALRAGHLLWSRLEVESWLLWLEGKSTSSRPSPGTEPASLEPTPAPAREGTGVRLRWTAVRARSVFYAAADHRIGQRTLLALGADKIAARRSADEVRNFAETLSATDPGPAPRPPAARPAPPPPPPPVGPRECHVCGQTVAAGARFCPHCGTAQPRV